MDDRFEQIKRITFKIFSKPEMPDNQKKKEVVYHYTSAENAIKIIKSKEIWLRNPSTMNDSNEVTHGFEIVDRIVDSDDVKAEFEKFSAVYNQDFYQLFSEIFRTLKIKCRSKVYLACFTRHETKTEEKYGRLSMWRAYGNSENRAALKLDLTDAISQTGLLLIDAQYKTEKQIKRYVIDTLNEILSLRTEFIKSGVRSIDLASILSVLLCLLAVGLKHKGFKEEREVRLVHLPLATDVTNFTHFSTEVVRGVPQLVYKIPLSSQVNSNENPISLDKVLKRILIGPTPYSFAILEALSDILTEAGFADTTSMIDFANIPLR